MMQHVPMPGAVQAALRDWMPHDAAAFCVDASADFDVPAVERARVANAVPQRQAEFIAARWCACRALAKLGAVADSLPTGALGAPVWPEGIIGSITHESGVCAAVAMRAGQTKGIGIDLFDRRRDTDMQAISHLVLARKEMDASGSAGDRTAWAQLSFSAKEAVVKAVSACAGRFLDMREIRLSIGTGFFDAALEGSSWRVTGRWANVGPFILTFAILGD